MADRLGVYLHIPFCQTKCHYCDFASGPFPEKWVNPYFEALQTEIQHSDRVLLKSQINPEALASVQVDSVYFGGGTPSLVDARRIIETSRVLRTVFEISPDGSSISQFATSLVSPYDLKFDSAGDLFVADNGDGTIEEYDPTGLLINTFSTGTGAWGLAFDNSDNLYVSDAGLNIYEYSPADYNTPGGGTPSVFTSDSGLFNGTYLAFPSSAETAPEQTSTLGLLAIGAMAILGGRRATARLNRG